MKVNKVQARSALANDIREIALDFPEGTLNATIRPLGMSPATQIRMAAIERKHASGDALDPEEVLRAVPQALSEMVAAWDLEDDDGNPVPPTQGAIRELPMDVIMVLFGEIGQAMAEGPKETLKSSRPSTRTAAKPRKAS